MTDDSCLVRGFNGQYSTADFNDAFIIGFAGLRGSGKSTIAATLHDELSAEGVDAVQMSFAGRVKEVASALIGSAQWEKSDLLYGDSDWDVRQFLMQFGTEFIRDNLGENFWVDVVAQQVLKRKPSVTIIDDMRFPNEYAFVQDLGAGILIERKGTEVHAGVHRSEMPNALGIRDTVANNTSVSDAVQSVRTIVSQNKRCPF